MAILPERFKKKPIGPPPGAEKKPAAVIAIGIGKKPGASPDDLNEPEDDSSAPEMPPKEGMDDALTPPAGAGDDAGGKESPEEAIVLRAGEKTCQTCTNWTPESGECSKVEGVFDPEDRCLRYYEAEGGEAGEEAAEGEPGSDMSMESPK